MSRPRLGVSYERSWEELRKKTARYRSLGTFHFHERFEKFRFEEEKEKERGQGISVAISPLLTVCATRLELRQKCFLCWIIKSRTVNNTAINISTIPHRESLGLSIEWDVATGLERCFSNSATSCSFDRRFDTLASGSHINLGRWRDWEFNEMRHAQVGSKN